MCHSLVILISLTNFVNIYLGHLIVIHNQAKRFLNFRYFSRNVCSKLSPHPYFKMHKVGKLFRLVEFHKSKTRNKEVICRLLMHFKVTEQHETAFSLLHVEAESQNPVRCITLEDIARSGCWKSECQVLYESNNPSLRQSKVTV